MDWIKFLSRLRNIPFKERKWGCRKYEYDPIQIDATELGASLLTKDEQVTYFKLKFKIASEMLKRQHLKALKEDE